MAGQAVAMPRSRHGESLKTPGLPDGIASFFPVHSEQSTLTQGILNGRLLIEGHVAAVRDAFAQLQTSTVGGSFPIIYQSGL